MKKLLIILAIVALAGSANAFPFLICDAMVMNDDEEIEWRWRKAGDPWGSWLVGTLQVVNGTKRLRHDLGPTGLPDGDLEFQARATNFWGPGPNSDILKEKKTRPSKRVISVGE